MKGFQQISDEILNKIYKLTIFNGIIIIIFLFCLMKMKYSVSVKVAGRGEIWPPKFVRHGQFIQILTMFSQNVCIFLFKE